MESRYYLPIDGLRGGKTGHRIEISRLRVGLAAAKQGIGSKSAAGRQASRRQNRAEGWNQPPEGRPGGGKKEWKADIICR